MQTFEPFVILNAPELRRSASQLNPDSKLFIADCQPMYANILKKKLVSVKRTKGTQTIDNNSMSAEEIEWFGASTPSCPPTFPHNNHPVHYLRLLAPPEQMNFALYPPTHFSGKTWEKIWQEGTLVLDLYVATVAPTLSDILRAPSDIYFRPEMEFTGFDYRVKIDENRCHEPLIVKAGDSVDILRTNMQHSRYIVDSCQLIRGGRAYLPVHYCDYYGQGFTNTLDSRHPSFILDVPESFRHSPVALRLRSYHTHTICLQTFPPQ